MSTAAGSNGSSAGVTSPQSKDKGKGRTALVSPNRSMEEDDDDEDDEDEDEDEDMDDEEEEEEVEEEEEDGDDKEKIDTSAIVGRRTRGCRVDYTSKEALEKAGLKPEDSDDDDEMK